MVEPNQNYTKIIKNITSSDARIWAFRNKISMLETDQNHIQILKKHYIEWCQIMSIQKQDFYDGG